MILDSEIQRNALLQLLKSSTFSGEQIEFVHGLYQAIRNADIRDCGTWKGSGCDDWAGLLRNEINEGK